MIEFIWHPNNSRRFRCECGRMGHFELGRCEIRDTTREYVCECGSRHAQLRLNFKGDLKVKDQRGAYRFAYRFAWGNNPRRRALRGRQCRILARGSMGSVLVAFLDTGEREIVSRRALRSAKARLDAATVPLLAHCEGLSPGE